MGIFKKRKSEVLDLTMLEEKGILNKVNEQQSMISSTDGVMDLSNSSGTSTFGETNTSTSTGESDGSSALGSLFSLAGAAEPSSTSSTDNNFSSSLTDAQEEMSPSERLREARRGRMVEFTAMKNKVEDLEYKLDRALEKIEFLEQQVDYFKNKID